MRYLTGWTDDVVQYYYNTQTQQFLYWDGEKSTYLPAPTSTDTQATAGQDGSAADAKRDEEQKKQSLTPEKKVKVAKKIVKVRREEQCYADLQ